MRPSLLIRLLGAYLALGLAPWPAAAYTTGPPPDRVALCNAGDTCKDAECHAENPLNAGLAELRLELAGTPPTPLPPTFRRGDDYRLLLGVVDPDPTRLAFGFQIGAVQDCPFAAQAGTLSVVDPERTRRVSDGRLLFVEHACPGLPTPTPQDCGFLPFAPGENDWEIDWQPGCALIHPVDFYFAVNAADGRGDRERDYIYIASATLLPPDPCPGQAPLITAVKADCDLASPGVADVSLAWDPVPLASGYAVYATEDPRMLATACTLAPVAPCAAMDGPALVFYSVAGLCADLSPGPL